MGLNIKKELEKAKTTEKGLIGLYKEVQSIGTGRGKNLKARIELEKKRITDLKEEKTDKQELDELKKKRKCLERQKLARRFEKITKVIRR